jgi:hypothetical protein
MKVILASLLLLINSEIYSQGFSSTAINWPLPPGGYRSSAINYSFNNIYGESPSSDIGSQYWLTIDMNGDSRPDILVFNENQAGSYRVFGLPNNPYWKVYLNTGTGFSATAINWTLPPGGYRSSGTNYSFNHIYGETPSSDIGSQYWVTRDMNGDSRPDILVYNENQAGSYRVFGLPNNPYWKVYLNTGTGFSATATNWTLPPGGYSSSATNYSFNNVYGESPSSDIGSQYWITMDMNGDNSPDILVYNENQAGSYRVFGLPNNPYWKVYLNTGTGFSATAINWTLPPGGYRSSATNYSFNNIYGETPSSDIGSQYWLTRDMNGDSKADILIYNENQAGSYRVFGLPNNPYWKVYLNTGTGFSGTATNWTLPPGGYISSSTNYSFNNVYGETPSSNIGSQYWITMDMNGDRSPDILVYNENQAGSYRVFGLPNNPYWKVYLNTVTSTLIQEENPHRVDIFPNPTEGKFIVSITDFKVESPSILITNLLGEEIKKGILQLGQNEINLLVPSGIYVVNIFSKDISISTNLIFIN